MFHLFFVLNFYFTLINSEKISSCIFNTPCQCLLTNDTFILRNCSYSLPDLPILNTNSSINLTTLIASNALIQWPKNLCKYSQIDILDLSYSFFSFQSIDIRCLYRLTYLNLSSTQLEQIPNLSKNLEILDLSNNQIEILHGNIFRYLSNLKQLYLQNNPLKEINHFENFFHLSYLNLISSKPRLILQKPLTVNQWIYLAKKWTNRNQTLIIRTNTIAFQSLFPQQFQLIPIEYMKIIFQILANSTFQTLVSTPECNCTDLENYQRIFSFIHENQTQLSLYQSATCLMPNGIIHARLFDRRILWDLHCIKIEKKSQNTASTFTYHFLLFFSLHFFMNIFS